MHVSFLMSFHCLIAHVFLVLTNMLLNVTSLFTPWRTSRLLSSFSNYEKTAIDICMNVFMWIQIFNSFGKIPQSAIPGSYGKSILKFVRNCRTVFQNGYFILQPHYKWMRDPVIPHSHQHLVLSVLWILAILKGM